MLNIPFAVATAASILPDLIGAIAETVDAVQKNHSDLPPEEKEKEALEAACKWYDALDSAVNLPDKVDQAAKENALPGLIKWLYRLAKYAPADAEACDVPPTP